MNKIKQNIIKLLGLDKIIENHYNAIVEIANAHNNSVLEFNKLNTYITDTTKAIQDNLQLMSNSLPKIKVTKPKSKVVKKVIHSKNKKILA